MIITPDNDYKELDNWLKDKKKIFLVCGNSIDKLKGVSSKLKQISLPIVRFSDFNPNPLYDSVVKGVRLFREEKCDCIIAVGGGSAIDVAKCIKLYSNQSSSGENGEWLSEKANPLEVPFLVVPTTAGTGSEVTRFAVIYYEGKKQSVTDESIIPNVVLLDPDTLQSLPLYQKKATMCDAFCHAIESYWSVNSTKESKEYSSIAIKGILDNLDGYLSNNDKCNKEMMYASLMAGKAINISQTTAGHAMCYKITSMFGVAHGHAAILCDRVIFSWMTKNLDKCVDSRGKEYFEKTLNDLGKQMGVSCAREGAEFIKSFFDRIELEIPKADSKQFEELIYSVDPVRLKNHPVRMDAEDIENLYHLILR